MQRRLLFSDYIQGSVFFLLLFFLTTPLGHAAQAGSVKMPINKQQLVPANFLDWGKDDTDYVILVDKSQQKIMVYRGDNPFVPEKVYSCSTGENDGPKSEKNDRKTPEGIYFFTNTYSEEYLSPIYGTRALPIDYPNQIDKKEGRGGYGIWLHGTNKPLKPNDTNGCVALSNEDIEEIASLVTVFETPVIISSHIRMVSPDELVEKADKIKEIIQRWKTAWQEKDIEQYISFYNRQFTSEGKNLSQWKEYKTRLAKKYKQIDLDIDDLMILANDGLVVASFKQTYRTPSFESYGTKKLYFTKNSEQWKIAGEFFKGKEKSRAVPVRKPPVFSPAEIEGFIALWKDSWEKEDIEGYVTCYDAGFRSRGMDLNAWKDHRERLNQKYHSLKIRITGLEIKRLKRDRASVSFIQDYMADNYRDLGKKKMILVRKGKDWKIKEEEWTPMKGKSRR